MMLPGNSLFRNPSARTGVSASWHYLKRKESKWDGFLHSPLPPKIMERYRPFPFKGKARMGMGSFATHYPIPTPPLPLKGREHAVTLLKVAMRVSAR